MNIEYFSHLRTAGTGVAAADDEAAEDRWGNFYSAYCPVFDSSGNIAGIIGIDYAASWYEEQIRAYTLMIAVYLILSVAVASFRVFLITHRVRKKFLELDDELSSISDTVDTLMDELSEYSGLKLEKKTEERNNDEPMSSDELEILSGKMHSMQNDLGQYHYYLNTQAFTDALTEVGNSSAYHERIDKIDLRIEI